MRDDAVKLGLMKLKSRHNADDDGMQIRRENPYVFYSVQL